MPHRFAAALCILLLPILVLPSAAAASEVRPLTLDGALQAAYEEGPGAARARLELAEMLLQAADLEHQHRLGPPGRQSISVQFDMGTFGEWLEENTEDYQPPRMTIPLGGPSDMEKAQIEEILPIQFASLRNTAKAAYVQRMSGVRTGIVEAYHRLILSREEVELRTAAVNRLEVQLGHVRAMYDRGVVPELDVIGVEAALAGVRADLFDAREAADLAQASLNRSLGQPLDTRLDPVTDVVPAEAVEADLRGDILEAREASAEVAALRGQLEVAEKEMVIFRRIKGTYSPRRAYHERELAVQRKQIELYDAKGNAEMAIWAIRSRIARAAQQVGAREGQVAAAQRGLEVARLKYGAGMVTISEVLEAESNLLGVELAHLSVSVELMAARADRNTLLGRVGPHVEETMVQIEAEIEGLR